MPNRIHGVIASVGAGLALPRGQGAASSARTLADVVRASAIAIHCKGDQPVAPTHGAIVTHERCRGTLRRARVTVTRCRGDRPVAPTETLKQRRPS